MGSMGVRVERVGQALGLGRVGRMIDLCISYVYTGEC